MIQPETIRRLLSWTSHRPKDQSIKRQRVTQLLDRLCPGLDSREIVKVAGTNGKGSVCAMIEACLKASGRTVGLFTSPHLQRVTERIRVNGMEIDPKTLEAYARDIEPQLRTFAEERGPGFIPSFFEVMMLIAGRVFIDKNVDYAIFEAGIGGGSDATALLPGRVSAITSISIDHEDRLGSSVSDIAKEKAGIATKGSTLVLGPGIGESLRAVICGTVSSNRVQVVQAGRGTGRVTEGASQRLSGEPLGDLGTPSNHDSGCSVDVRQRSPHGTVLAVSHSHGDFDCDLPSLPDYQLDNLATAVAVLKCLSHAGGVPFPQSLRGLRGSLWPGRFEHVEGSPAWLLDGAHNEEGIKALTAAVDRDFATANRILIYGASKDKSYGRYLARLPGLATRAYVTDDFHNAQKRHAIAAELPEQMKVCVWDRSIEELVRLIRDEESRPDTLAIVTGSLFLIGRARSALELHDVAGG